MISEKIGSWFVSYMVSLLDNYSIKVSGFSFIEKKVNGFLGQVWILFFWHGGSDKDTISNQISRVGSGSGPSQPGSTAVPGSPLVPG